MPGDSNNTTGTDTTATGASNTASYMSREDFLALPATRDLSKAAGRALDAWWAQNAGAQTAQTASPPSQQSNQSSN